MNHGAERFDQAVSLFFAGHAEDPRQVERDGKQVPAAVVYHERLRDWLAKLAPEASEPLRLAANCQHIRRWRIPRTDYPEGRLGYRKWRHDLAEFHGEEAAAILSDCGYGSETIERVRALLKKENFARDPDGQMLQDVVCLVFLEHDFEEFAPKYETEKIVTILRKTLRKMSPKGQAEAQKLAQTLPENLQELVRQAVAD